MTANELMPDSPTREDVSRAVDLIKELLADFPFADVASRANAIALLLTMFLIDVVRGHRPLFLIDANQAGSGKTLLAQVVGIIATLCEPRMISGSFRNDAELEKQVTEALSACSPLILVDNVKEPVESATLESAVTAQRWTRRVLGKNTEAVDVDQRSVFMVTGNNLAVGSEIARRSVLIRLRSETNAPELRTEFRHPNLIEWTRANRERLAAAVITLAVAWHQAGRPVHDAPVMGSFQSWANTLSGILAFAGIEGFMANRDHFREQRDVESEEWSGFLLALRVSMNGAPLTAREISARVRAGGSLKDAAPDEVLAAADELHGGTTRKLTAALRRYEGRRFDEDGLRLERAGTDGHAKVILWRVMVDPAVPEEDVDE